MKKLFWSVNAGFISVLPILYLVSYLILGVKRGPFFWVANQDPDYAYLGNSLKLALFQAPSHTDHPGTPLQIIGAVLMRGEHFLNSIANPRSTDLVTDVLTHPEIYLWTIHTTLVLLTACALLLLGFGTFRLCQNLPLAILIQSSPLLIIGAHFVIEPSRVSPDVLVFCISQLLALLLVYYLYRENTAYRENAAQSGKWLIGLGIIFGLGMATKVTFLATIWFFLLIKGTRRKIIALSVAVATFIVATAPIISQYPRMLGWFESLATHTGPYRTGGQGLFNPVDIWKNFGILASNAQIFIGILFLSTVVSVALLLLIYVDKKRFKNANQSLLRKSAYLLFLTTLVWWTQILMTLTEFPKIRYLDPSLGLVGFMLFLLTLCLTLLTTQWLTERTRLSSRQVAQRLGAIALTICWLIGIQQVNLASQSIGKFSTLRRNDLAQIETLYNSEKYRTCIKVNSWRTSSIESSLHFMNIWSGKSFGSVLEKLHPGIIIYKSETNRFQSYSQPIPAPQVTGQDCVLLQSLTIPKGVRNDIQNQKFSDVFVGKVESVYRFK